MEAFYVSSISFKVFCETSPLKAKSCKPEKVIVHCVLKSFSQKEMDLDLIKMVL